MISKTIKAKNSFTKELEERTLYFNLTKAEALEINLMENLEAVGKSDNPRKIIPVFKRILRAAYGVKLPNNKFTKDDEETSDFLASDHYSELLISILEEPAAEKAMSEFIKSILDFDVNDIDKNAPTRPEPQDYKPSAREIAAQAAAKKEDLVVEERHTDPAEAKRVPNYPAEDRSTSFENSPEYKAYLERQQAEQANEPVNIGDQPLTPGSSAITSTAPDEHQPAFRRDNN